MLPAEIPDTRVQWAIRAVQVQRQNVDAMRLGFVRVHRQTAQSLDKTGLPYFGPAHHDEAQLAQWLTRPTPRGEVIIQNLLRGLAGLCGYRLHKGRSEHFIW